MTEIPHMGRLVTPFIMPDHGAWARALDQALTDTAAQLYAQAGRQHGHFGVTDAKRLRVDIRRELGSSSDEPPTVAKLLRAARDISRLLNDASAGQLLLTTVLHNATTPIAGSGIQRARITVPPGTLAPLLLLRS